ncbi:hypothetical protein KUCAC02_035818 [Chaenocephalus aceratus]|nr:hypothetical protein KUCAC02_035818 [Chaenocephalus aceratus]
MVCREVTCEENFMQVSVRSDVACPIGTMKADWDAVVQTAYASAASDWQVMFQRVDEEPTPMSLAEAHELGYEFDLTEGRLVNSVPVEAAHVTLFSRQHWVVLMVDLVAACSMGQCYNI